mmetsp:Transcript_9179/g.24528  ORF Transcript_9179/g.24528 Transcript_9179/m.24528 type:complete len:268 (-) Transcript_9179:160-963(-)
MAKRMFSACIEHLTGTMFSVGVFMWWSSVSSSEMLRGGERLCTSCLKAFVTSSSSSCRTAGRKSSRFFRSRRSKTGTSRRGFEVAPYSRVTASPYSGQRGCPSLPWLACIRMCSTFSTSRSVSGVALRTSESTSCSEAGMYLMASSMELTRCSFMSGSHSVKVSTSSWSRTGRLMQRARYSHTLSLGTHTAPLKRSPRSCSTRSGTFTGRANLAALGAMERSISVATSSMHLPLSFSRGRKSSSGSSQEAPPPAPCSAAAAASASLR